MLIIPDLKRLIDFIAHRRMIAFWAVAAVALPAPWLMPGCASRMATENKNVYENCQVLNVHDGDTMTVNCQGEKIKVRLYCIDAPELEQEPWGKEARDYLRSITGPNVRLEVKDKDRYGRSVALVHHDEEPLNLRVVQAGWAAVYERYCTNGEYLRAEAESRARSRGIWKAPAMHLMPWHWRKRSENK